MNYSTNEANSATSSLRSRQVIADMGSNPHANGGELLQPPPRPTSMITPWQCLDPAASRRN